MSARRVLVVAGLTLREMARRRVLWVLLGLVVVSVILVGWGTERLVTLAREDRVGEAEIRIGVSQVLILIAFMFSYVLAMSAAFLAAAMTRRGIALDPTLLRRSRESRCHCWRRYPLVRRPPALPAGLAHRWRCK